MATPDTPVTLRIFRGNSGWQRGQGAACLSGALRQRFLPVHPFRWWAPIASANSQDTEFTATSVTLHKTYRSGGYSNIVPRGEDLTAGDIVARQGTVIDSALMGTSATQNLAQPKVYRRPLAGIITTPESELCGVGDALTGGKIVNSNRYTFQGVLSATPFRRVTDFFGCPGDTVEEIAAAFSQAAEACDVIITTGGCIGGRL